MTNLGIVNIEKANELVWSLETDIQIIIHISNVSIITHDLSKQTVPKSQNSTCNCSNMLQEVSHQVPRTHNPDNSLLFIHTYEAIKFPLCKVLKYILQCMPHRACM